MNITAVFITCFIPKAVRQITIPVARRSIPDAAAAAGRKISKPLIPDSTEAANILRCPGFLPAILAVSSKIRNPAVKFSINKYSP